MASNINFNKVRYFHDSVNGASFGYAPDAYIPGIVHVAFAVCSENDQFNRKIARALIDWRLKQANGEFSFAFKANSRTFENGAHAHLKLGCVLSVLLFNLCGRFSQTREELVSKVFKNCDGVERIQAMILNAGFDVVPYAADAEILFFKKDEPKKKPATTAVDQIIDQFRSKKFDKKQWTMNGKRVRFFHDSENKFSVAMLQSGTRLLISFAVCHDNDVFSKKESRQISFDRLVNRAFDVPLNAVDPDGNASYGQMLKCLSDNLKFVDSTTNNRNYFLGKMHLPQSKFKTIVASIANASNEADEAKAKVESFYEALNDFANRFF